MHKLNKRQLADIAEILDHGDGVLHTYQPQALADARVRIIVQTYGICDGCKKGIGYTRLLAHPTATMCFSCQIQVEQGK